MHQGNNTNSSLFVTDSRHSIDFEWTLTLGETRDRTRKSPHARRRDVCRARTFFASSIHTTKIIIIQRNVCNTAGNSYELQ